VPGLVWIVLSQALPQGVHTYSFVCANAKNVVAQKRRAKIVFMKSSFIVEIKNTKLEEVITSFQFPLPLKWLTEQT
jgi:hypothetical protein